MTSHSKGSFEEIVAQVTNVPKEESKTGIPMPAKGGSSISDDDVIASSGAYRPEITDIIPALRIDSAHDRQPSRRLRLRLSPVRRPSADSLVSLGK